MHNRIKARRREVAAVAAEETRPRLLLHHLKESEELRLITIKHKKQHMLNEFSSFCVHVSFMFLKYPPTTFISALLQTL